MSEPARQEAPLWTAMLLSGLALLSSGCSDSNSSDSVSSKAAASVPTEPSEHLEVATAPSASTPPPAAIDDQAEPIEFVEPEQGSPEWLMREIVRIRAEVAAATDPDDPSGPTITPQAHRERQAEIINRAHEVIAATHEDRARELLFNNAVRFLADARIELALAGDATAADFLAEDAELLYRRDPKSFAAAEAGFKLVQLAQRTAEQHGGEDSQWISEYANQARVFAEKFPSEQSRAAVMLIDAGKFCDRLGLIDDARACFETVATKYADTPFAEQVGGFLRRMNLVGQPLELAGPTIDGGFAEIDDYRGRVVLVVFWSTTSPTFRSDLPEIKQAEDQFAERGLSIIGVNLDTDEFAVDTFIGEQALGWPQVFFSERDKRGGASPLARYYGIHSLPTYWLVDGKGIVRRAPQEIESLTVNIAALLATL